MTLLDARDIRKSYGRGAARFEFELVPMVTIVLVVMLIAFLAGTLPARRAARQNPIDALRYE